MIMEIYIWIGTYVQLDTKLMRVDRRIDEYERANIDVYERSNINTFFRGMHARQYANIHIYEYGNVIVYEREIDAYEYGYVHMK